MSEAVHWWQDTGRPFSMLPMLCRLTFRVLNSSVRVQTKRKEEQLHTVLSVYICIIFLFQLPFCSDYFCHCNSSSVCESEGGRARYWITLQCLRICYIFLVYVNILMLYVVDLALCCDNVGETKVWVSDSWVLWLYTANRTNSFLVAKT